jgi:hypothetical protein
VIEILAAKYYSVRIVGSQGKWMLQVEEKKWGTSHTFVHSSIQDVVYQAKEKLLSDLVFLSVT